MSEDTTADDTRRDEARVKIQQALEALKAEVAQRLDQILDELGAII